MSRFISFVYIYTDIYLARIALYLQRKFSQIPEYDKCLAEACQPCFPFVSNSSHSRTSATALLLPGHVNQSLEGTLRLCFKWIYLSFHISVANLTPTRFVRQ